MDLARLVDGIAHGAVPAGIRVGGLARDSRAVKEGDLFVAVPGVTHDGAAFARQAAALGAVAIVAERALPELEVHGIPVLRAQSAARALGALASRYHGEPCRDVDVVGVTGTNGKTTTAFLTQALLNMAGRPAALLSTVCARVGGKERASSQTTPCVLETHSALAAARAAAERALVMEVSSHALDQDRVAGVDYRVGVFTNLTRDHLDYHGTVAAYGDAKARLFEGLSHDAVAVLNARHPFSKSLAARTPAKVLRYAWVEGRGPWPNVEVGARIEGETAAGTSLRLRLHGPRLTLVLALHLPLIGRFNVENALGAAGAALALGVRPAAVAQALAQVPGVPGRLERVSTNERTGPTVLVDYAHTPDALERVLASLRPLTPGRLITVFGCGGDRDPGKRAPMGRAALEHSDLAILTSDNPRSEDPAEIAADVLAGCPADSLCVVLDRETAIAHAVAEAQPGDVVLIAGKGHETTQEIDGRKLPFDDRQVARQALRDASISGSFTHARP